MPLSYADLKAKAEKKAHEKGLPFIARDGKQVFLRPLLSLSKVEGKNALALVSIVENDKRDLNERLEAIDAMLVVASDRKRAMKDSLGDLDSESRMEIFQAWMEAAQGPEASDSTS
ncbi:hypothetical protein [Spirillospora sp. CA-294931]|uniref:hypothetical protein n=1 Tax=Spirillospora sp. CA-294931 TaxID=3240042 RepID=UPI003D8D735C